MADTQTQTAGTTSQTTGATQDPSLLAKFEIPETVKSQYPDLIPLILETESMNDDERQYWFQILPIMTEEQVTKLREILVNEKNQLQELDKEYQRELKRINEKHVTQWQAVAAKEKREKIAEAESKSQTAEKAEEETLMKKLQEL